MTEDQLDQIHDSSLKVKNLVKGVMCLTENYDEDPIANLDSANVLLSYALPEIKKITEMF